MRVMPANASGWFWHCLARETGSLGHLFSPGAQRGPWPWFPYALDNGAFSCWDKDRNQFDDEKWAILEPQWLRLIEWAGINTQKPIWAIVPDVPGSGERTIDRYMKYAGLVPFTRAVAVQDGMTEHDVLALDPMPEVICVGGTDEFKKGTWRKWKENFPRVHVLRVNSPTWLGELRQAGIESCDGTGWNRGDTNQTRGMEMFVRSHSKPYTKALYPFVCRDKPIKGSGQESLL